MSSRQVSGRALALLSFLLGCQGSLTQGFESSPPIRTIQGLQYLERENILIFFLDHDFEQQRQQRFGSNIYRLAAIDKGQLFSPSQGTPLSDIVKPLLNLFLLVGTFGVVPMHSRVPTLHIILLWPAPSDRLTPMTFFEMLAFASQNFPFLFWGIFDYRFGKLSISCFDSGGWQFGLALLEDVVYELFVLWLHFQFFCLLDLHNVFLFFRPSGAVLLSRLVLLELLFLIGGRCRTIVIVFSKSCILIDLKMRFLVGGLAHVGVIIFLWLFLLGDTFCLRISTTHPASLPKQIKSLQEIVLIVISVPSKHLSFKFNHSRSIGLSDDLRMSGQVLKSGYIRDQPSFGPQRRWRCKINDRRRRGVVNL